MTWEKIKLQNCCLSIADGDHQPPPKAENGIPFITISNFTNTNDIDFTNTMFVPDKYYHQLDSKRKAQSGDILYSVVGSFGIPVLIKEKHAFVFQRHIAILRPDKNKIDPAFLFYTMLNSSFYAKADAVAVGSAQRTISLGALRNIEINLPNLSVQQRIVKVLSAYDELIEVNQKQIRLLEEAARRLYREWFVDLRFPGHEDTPITDGIPAGWSKEILQNTISYEIGGGWGEDYPTGKYSLPAYVFRGTDLFGLTHGELTSLPFRYHSENNLKSRKIISGDIIFEVSGGSRTEGVAKTALITQPLLDYFSSPIICASFCKLIRAKTPEFSFYLYATLRHLRDTGKTTEYDKRSASSIVKLSLERFFGTTITFNSPQINTRSI